jgi:hypothetical protein
MDFKSKDSKDTRYMIIFYHVSETCRIIELFKETFSTRLTNKH